MTSKLYQKRAKKVKTGHLISKMLLKIKQDVQVIFMTLCSTAKHASKPSKRTQTYSILQPVIFSETPYAAKYQVLKSAHKLQSVLILQVFWIFRIRYCTFCTNLPEAVSRNCQANITLLQFIWLVPLCAEWYVDVSRVSCFNKLCDKAMTTLCRGHTFT